MLSTLRKHLKEVLISWDEAKFNPNQSLKDLGVDSLDSVLILMGSLKELGIKFLDLDRLKTYNVSQIADTIAGASETDGKDSPPEREQGKPPEDEDQ